MSFWRGVFISADRIYLKVNLEVNSLSKAIIAKKEKLVDDFAAEIKEAKAILVIDYLGLTVEEVTNLRKDLRDSNVKMKVIKNTYLKRAAEKAGIEGLDDTFVVLLLLFTLLMQMTLLNQLVLFLNTKMISTHYQLKVVCSKVRLPAKKKSRNLQLFQVAKVYFQCLYLYYKLQFATLHMLLRLSLIQKTNNYSKFTHI